MVYGIILLLNFAHGDIIMVGAYAAFYAMTNFHLHPIVSVIIAVITSTLLGVVIEKVAYTPLRKAPRLSLLITAIGISFLLENGAQLLFGSDTKHGSHCSGQYLARLCDHQQCGAADYRCDYHCNGA